MLVSLIVISKHFVKTVKNMLVNELSRNKTK